MTNRSFGQKVAPEEPLAASIGANPALNAGEDAGHRSRLQHYLYRAMVIFFTSLVIFAVLAVAALILLQEKMIYFPQPYGTGLAEGVSGMMDRGVQLSFTTDEGQQYTYYIAPPENPLEPPEHLWMFFGGNASLALGWQWTVEQQSHPRAGFLLVEYPGYGENEGRPNPKGILDNATKSLEALAAHLNTPVSDLESNVSIGAHSLGCAAALQYAVTIEPKRMYLLAPFTSLRDMAQRTVGKPLHLLLRHRYDNRARLAELMERENPPEVTIVVAHDDPIVPADMGRELAANHPDQIELIQINGMHETPVDWFTINLHRIVTNGSHTNGTTTNKNGPGENGTDENGENDAE